MTEEERKKKEAEASMDENERKMKLKKEIAMDKAGMDLHFTAMTNWLEATEKEQKIIGEKVNNRVKAKLNELEALMEKIKNF